MIRAFEENCLFWCWFQAAGDNFYLEMSLHSIPFQKNRFQHNIISSITSPLNCPSQMESVYWIVDLQQLCVHNNMPSALHSVCWLQNLCWKQKSYCIEFVFFLNKHNTELLQVHRLHLYISNNPMMPQQYSRTVSQCAFSLLVFAPIARKSKKKHPYPVYTLSSP